MPRALFLFGPLRLIEDDTPLPVPGAKGRLLLTYLALFPRANHARERLADLLWPEAPPGRGRRLLSNLIYQINSSLCPDWLNLQGEQVHLAEARVDVHEFDRLANQPEPEAWEQALGLYRDDLLPDLYDDWLLNERMERRETCIDLLDRLVRHRQEQGDLSAAAALARRLVMTEPLREEHQQTYLRLLGRLGRRNEALAHYEYLHGLLQKELGIEPLPETRAIAAAIRREASEGQPVPPAGERFPFAGRQQERLVLVGAIERLLSGQGGAYALEGAAGMGKSRLLREIAASAAWRGLRAGVVTVEQTESDAPLAPLQEALAGNLPASLRAWLENQPPQPDPRTDAKSCGSALRPEPDLRPTLAALAPLIPAWGEFSDLPELPPEHQRYRLRQALHAILERAASRQPLVFLFDDLHLASPALWETLQELIDLAAAGKAVLVILAYCRPEIEGLPAWKTIQTWERHGSLRPLRLGPLTEAEIGQLLPAAERSRAADWFGLSGGSPFWLTEALTAHQSGLPLSRALGHGLAERAAVLPPAERHALECAAILGKVFPFQTWAALSGLPHYELAGIGEALTAQGFLRPTPAGYAFRQEFIHTALLHIIPAERAAGLHGRAAAVLQKLEPQEHLRRAGHLAAAGQAEEAAADYRRAAHQSQAQSAYYEALQALEHALELTLAGPSADAPGVERAELLLEVANLAAITQEGETESRAVAAALSASAALADPLLQARAALRAGESASNHGESQAAEMHLKQASENARQAGNLSLEGQASTLLGDLALRTGDMLLARQHYGRQLEIARQTGDAAQEAAALEGLGFALANSGGEMDEVLHTLETALQMRRKAGDRFQEARASNSLLAFLQAAGRLAQVLEFGPQALALNEFIGYARGANIARASLGLAYNALGDYRQAQALLAAARDYFIAVDDPDAVGLYTGLLGQIAERSGDPRLGESLQRAAITTLESGESDFFAAQTRMDLGDLLVRQERYEEALPVLQAAIAVFQANQTPMELQRCQALTGRTHLHAAGGDPAGRQAAAALADQGWQVFQSDPPQGEERQYTLWALSRLLAELGRADQAAAVLEEAYATLQRQAASLGASELRRQFFEAVPLNRQISAEIQARRGAVSSQRARLARAGTPLGRPLTEADRIEIEWTLHAPQDETIPDKGQRRLSILRRLVEEAAAQGAAPTDDDLAQALGVSRRTILRDMAELDAQGLSPATRRRKRDNA